MKQTIIAGIIGSFIGYALFAFINGIVNNYFYNSGLKLGTFIKERIRGQQ